MTLLTRLRAAEVGSQELDFAIYAAMRPTNDPKEHAAMWDKDKDEYWFWMSPAHYTTSLDAALALAERVITTRGPIDLSIMGSAQVVIHSADPCGNPLASEYAPTPALALCCAIIAAKEGASS